MLTHTERDFVIEVIKELAHLDDELLDEEVLQAIEILEKLKPIDNTVLMDAMEKSK